MINLTDKQIAEYFKRSYTASDGLWFMKMEEKYGFDEALDIDNEVWKVLPKIQARALKGMGNLKDGLQGLRECVTTRLTLEGFTFEDEPMNQENHLKITIHECPWHNLMIKSNRVHLSERVGTRICNTEYQVLASEFGDGIDFQLQTQICKGEKCCALLFTLID